MHLQSDTLLLADEIESFHINNIGICNVGLAHFFHYQDFIASSLKRDKSTLTGIDMLLMIEEGIRGGIRHTNNQYTEANNIYMKDHDKSKDPLYLLHWDGNNSYRWAM